MIGARTFRWLKGSTGGIVSVFGVAVGVFAVTSLLVHGFSSPNNLRNLLIEISILGVASAGQMVAIVGGGIDLSIPWVMTSSAVLIADLSQGHDGDLWYIMPGVMAFGIVVGVVNGLGVALIGVPPIIMTLSTNVMLSGGILLFAGSSPPSTSPSFVASMVFSRVLGVPVLLPELVAVLVLVSVFLARSAVGRRLYAIGASQRVSVFSGIAVTRTLVYSYVVSSVCAVIAGWLLLGYTQTAYMGMGDPYQFESIAAVVIGGASILGGTGRHIGTVGGVILLTVLTALLTVLSLGAGAISIFFGLTILVGVGISRRGDAVGV